MRGLMEHSGRGHLRPASLLCRKEALRWRCKLVLALVPVNLAEHCLQLSTELPLGSKAA